MDPATVNTLSSIALNVASSGLTSLLVLSGQQLNKAVIGKDTLEQQKIDQTALQPILQQAITKVAENAPWDAPRGLEVASLFLRTAEVEELVRQIYATKWLEHEDITSLASIRTLFVTLLTHYVMAYAPDFVPDANQLATAAPKLFDALVEGCDLLLTQAIDKGILTAHEAKESFRHHALQNQLAAIQKELELLSTPYKPDIKAILDFEKTYRECVGHRCSYIVPPNLQSTQRHPIDALYVSPNVLAIEQKEPLDRNAFFAHAYRAVVLGNPGAGKSTLATKLCYDLAHHYTQRIFAERKELTPILVILRQYGADRKERRCSLLEFIETEARTTYQQPSVPSQAFYYLLLSGRAIVIFDGLDELLDTSYRQDIRNDIEIFCHLYPSVPVLVTSREVGYDQAPLDKNLFNIFRIAPFNKDQIELYVKNWFTIANTEDITIERRKGMAEKFLKDSRIVPDLRTNPLMLSLLCTIYREEGYIPRYRPDVYEKCALLLFERWDKSRHIYTPPLPEEHVRPLMEYLANWIYEDEQLRAGITTTELAMKATEYLHDWLYEDRYKAKRTAHEFIEFCTGRAWVFTDTGTQKDGENLYQFAHSTFLEYFAASHLVRTSRTPKDLLEILMPHIMKAEWDVVAQLAFQLYSKQSVGASDELFMALIEKPHANMNSTGFNLLSFAARCLQFIIPRPQVRRAITKACVDWCVTWGCEQLEKELPQENMTYSSNDKILVPATLFDYLEKAIVENHITVNDTLNDLLIAHINSNCKNKLIISLEILLYVSFHEGEGITKSIHKTCYDNIAKVYPASILLCLDGLWDKRIHAKDLINWHGIECLFKPCFFTIYPQLDLSIIFHRIHLQPFFEVENYIDKFREWYICILKDIGSSILSYPTPWIKRKASVPYYIAHSFTDAALEFVKIIEKSGILDNNILFGLSIYFFIATEINNEFSIPQSRQGYFSFSLLCIARSKLDLVSEVQKTLDQYHFSAEQQHFIWRWIRKEINLVADE